MYHLQTAMFEKKIPSARMQILPQIQAALEKT